MRREGRGCLAHKLAGKQREGEEEREREKKRTQRAEGYKCLRETDIVARLVVAAVNQLAHRTK
jgi:hypothetical protein